MSTLDNKISIVMKIREAKDILFGNISNGITHEQKAIAWKKISNYAKTIGLIGKERSYTYLRDVTWTNIKRSTMRKTVASKGRRRSFTLLDDLVMEIINDKDRPIKCGKVTMDILMNDPLLEDLNKQDHLDNDEEKIENYEEEIDSHTLHNNLSKNNANRKDSTSDFEGHEIESHQEETDNILKKRKSYGSDEYENDSDFKKKKNDLQLEHLTLQNYKIKLEIFEMECRMNVPHSEYTSCIVNATNYNRRRK